MKKVEIMQTYKDINEWFQSLNEIEEQKWYAPIEKGKWSNGGGYLPFIILGSIFLRGKITVYERRS